MLCRNRGDSRVVAIGLVLLSALLASQVACAKTKIRYRHWGNNVWIEATVAAFNRSQNEVEVEFEPLNHGDKLAVELAAGTGPEVFSTATTYGFGLWPEQNRALLYDLTPLVERDKAAIALADVPPSVVQEQLRIMGGRWYGFPFIVYLGSAVWYNRTMFDQVGLSVPPESWNLDEYVARARKLTCDVNGDGTPDVWGACPAGRGFAGMKNARFFSEDGSTFLSDDPAVRRGMQFIDDVYNNFRITPQGGVSLQGGNCVMLLGMSNMIEYVRQGLEAGVGEFGVQVTPWDVESGTRGWQRTTGNSLSINGNIAPEKLEAAWRFIRFFVSEAGVKAGYDAVGSLQIPPPHLRLISKYYLNPKGIYQGFDLSVFLKNIPHLTGDDIPRTHFSEIDSILNAGINDVISGRKAAEVVLAEIGPRINSMLAAK